MWVETHFYIFLKVIIGGFKILYNILILCKTKFDIVAKLYTPIECDLLIGVKPTGFVWNVKRTQYFTKVFHSANKSFFRHKNLSETHNLIKGNIYRFTDMNLTVYGIIFSSQLELFFLLSSQMMFSGIFSLILLDSNQPRVFWSWNFLLWYCQ